MDLLTSSDAAAMLGVSKWHVSRLARQGKLTPELQLPGLRGAYLFDPATVAELAAARGDR